MRAMLLEKPKTPLKFVDLPIPEPTSSQVLLQVEACGVCRTDLHIRDGELTHPHLPLILGHQIVGIVTGVGSKVKNFKIGDCVGVPWLGGCCDACEYCLSGRENLCDHGIFTGYQAQGGFAEYAVANASFCFPIPAGFSPLQAAPLLCGGLIGYRALRMTGNAKTLGFYGFGSSAHLLTQAAVYQGKSVYVFTRPGDERTQAFAKTLKAIWAGGTDELPPVELDAAIIFAPAGDLVLTALKALAKGGVVVCAGIYMSDIPSFPYSLLYGERMIRSVTNLTRQDGNEFLALASKVPIHSQVNVYPLEKANQALDDLKQGKVNGSVVLQIKD
ncbi:zinc-dependent alcohol dehydrogenase family protein [Parachlamydia acanthamoebae]|jgi:propanol-preferring alcohol dehydrogenase|uniref:zinc-dependent alcohol dehydrogenase family protein n=1 Tax=Parachlamydia acanthamoebae TaxID=83552 RepID=UPI0024E1B9E1|nr:zinc-dependent alcohol dehydrogenase family protein [Parachlamydia acanthamoebae]